MPHPNDVADLLRQAESLGLHKAVLVSELTDGTPVILCGGTATTVMAIWMLERAKLVLMNQYVQGWEPITSCST